MRKRGQPHTPEQIKMVHALGPNATVKQIQGLCDAFGIARDFIREELKRKFPDRTTNRYVRAQAGIKKSLLVASEHIKFKEMSVAQFQAKHGIDIYKPHNDETVDLPRIPSPPSTKPPQGGNWI